MLAASLLAGEGAGWPAASLPALLELRPVLALLVASLGLLLILVEFERPGWVVPGALGTLLLLLGAYALARQPLRPGALGGLPGAVALLATPWRVPRWRWAVVVAGVALLCACLVSLPQRPQTAWTGTALAVGVVLGVASGMLSVAAGRARQAKAVTRSRQCSGGSSAGAAERWE